MPQSDGMCERGVYVAAHVAAPARLIESEAAICLACTAHIKRHVKHGRQLPRQGVSEGQAIKCE